MNDQSSKRSDKSRREHLHVERDKSLADDSTRGSAKTPAAGDVNPPDEYFARGDKPLPPDSPAAKALHEHPPRAKGELGVGSAGDAARPTKEGITGKPIPPRGHL